MTAMVRTVPPEVYAAIRASGPCVYCGNQATDVDHVQPLALGGRAHESNLVPACRSCNASKGPRPLTEWRRADRVAHGVAHSPKVAAAWARQRQTPRGEDERATSRLAPIVRAEPPYQQIVEHIRRRIRSGELHDGDLVPSTRQLARDWQVSPPTAAKALATLRSAGLVRGVAGTGTVVCGDTTTHNAAADLVRSVRPTGRIYLPNERPVIKSAALVPAPALIAGALGLSACAAVIRLHRITVRDDAPISASVTWLDGKLAEVTPRLLVAERILRGTPGYIEEATGRKAVRGVDQDSVRAATAQDAEDLGVPIGSPVPCGLTWWYDAGGAVLEYGERVSVPGRWSTHEYFYGEHAAVA